MQRYHWLRSPVDSSVIFRYDCKEDSYLISKKDTNKKLFYIDDICNKCGHLLYAQRLLFNYTVCKCNKVQCRKCRRHFMYCECDTKNKQLSEDENIDHKWINNCIN